MSRSYDLKPEDQLLLNCSLTHPSENNIQKIKQLTAQNLDWNYLINMAYLHRLIPLLYWHLNKISPEVIPSNLKRELQEYFHKNAIINLGMLKELLKVIYILQEKGITPIPYKGPVLAIMTYKNLGFRLFGDLDFYVPLKDVPKTRDILIKKGYKSWMDLSPNQERAFYKFQREYHFTNKETNIELEIKWKFLSLPISGSEELFFQENGFLREVEINQFKVKTISPEYLILILSIHNGGHSFSSLYRFCDLSELIKSEDDINWQHLLKTACELGMKRIFMVNLYVLQDLFGLKFPEEVSELINNDMDVKIISQSIISRLFKSKPMSMKKKAILAIKLRENTEDKVKTLLNMVFLPTPGVIKSISLARALEPVYYIFRFFQMLKNVIIYQ